MAREYKLQRETLTHSASHNAKHAHVPDSTDLAPQMPPDRSLPRLSPSNPYFTITPALSPPP
jgi:hypothetical protein